MNQFKLHTPPKIACAILHWTLPATIREQLIGDLFEEFDELIQEQDLKKARQWFWQQSIHTTLLYLWKEKGGLMAFVVSILIFGAMTALAMILGAELKYYWDWASVFIVVPPALAFGIAATSFKSYKESLAMAFVDQTSVEKKDADGACRFLRVTGNTGVLLGIFTSMIGWVAMAAKIGVEEFTTVFGPAFAVSVLTILYGLMLKILCYTAENKIIYRYLSE